MIHGGMEQVGTVTSCLGVSAQTPCIFSFRKTASFRLEGMAWRCEITPRQRSSTVVLINFFLLMKLVLHHDGYVAVKTAVERRELPPTFHVGV
jgi:hypothetical protein